MSPSRHCHHIWTYESGRYTRGQSRLLNGGSAAEARRFCSSGAKDPYRHGRPPNTPGATLAQVNASCAFHCIARHRHRDSRARHFRCQSVQRPISRSMRPRKGSLSTTQVAFDQEAEIKWPELKVAAAGGGVGGCHAQLESRSICVLRLMLEEEEYAFDCQRHAWYVNAPPFLSLTCGSAYSQVTYHPLLAEIRQQLSINQLITNCRG